LTRSVSRVQAGYLSALVVKDLSVLRLELKWAVKAARGSRSSKTFKPKKNIPEGSHQYELLKHAEATLGSGNLRMAVMLPEGEDLNEWVAVN
ncbi:PREDICTED: MOB kinase activator 1B-like, partial [Eurypyga helias]|uniref:MOB kinase activator 1B-like n=1 Tax=Eurypyga helias TaxID=54383 RepID=UPI000528C634